ncbi:MAG: hypothetical protein K2P90_02110 [Holosporales bacterium]|nr:hypothetical protein [Holosporales bacterium]
MEIVLKGNQSKTWSQDQESARDDVLHVPLPTRAEIADILSSESAREAEKKRLENLLDGAQNGKIIRLTRVNGIRSGKDWDTLEEWRKLEVFNPVGKEVGLYEWDAITLRSLPCAPGSEVQRNFLEKLARAALSLFDSFGVVPVSFMDHVRSVEFLEALEARGANAIHKSAVISASLITPAKSSIYCDRNGVILGIPSENIVCASASDLMTPLAEDCLYAEGYVNPQMDLSRRWLYRALKKLRTPKDVTVDLLSCRHSEICTQPYDSETQTSISINGFYVIENERDIQKWSKESLLYFEAAKKGGLPLVRLSKERSLKSAVS